MFREARAPRSWDILGSLIRAATSLWLLFGQRVVAMQCQAGVEAVADVEMKLRQDITPAPDADPLFCPVHRSCCVTLLQLQ